MTTAFPSQEKVIADMTAADRKVVSQLLQWQGKPLRDCSRGELIQCIIHMTAQVVKLKDRLDKVEIQPDGSKILETEHEPIQ